MNLSSKHRGPLAAASVVCLTLLSGGAWAEGADAAPDTNQDRRTNPQTRPLGRDGNAAPAPQTRQGSQAPNPQTPPIPQQRRTETNREVQPRGEDRRRDNNRRDDNWRDNTGRDNIGRDNTGRGNAGRDYGRRDNDRRDNNWRDNDRRDPPRWTEHGWFGPSPPPAHRRHYHIGPERHEVRPDRRRVYRNVVVLRPYGGWYHGYGHYYTDHDAYRWLGLTAITCSILSRLNEQQQRALEDAQIAATTAPIGAPIIWGDPYARGTVIATRDGWSNAGRYCREFQQTVEIGGRMEQAYATACQQPDGSWQVTSQ